MTYIQGFVIPVRTENKDAYRDMAARAAPMFKEYGALRIVECWGDAIPDGETTDFRKAVKAEQGENVVFSWIVWPSKEVHDEAQKTMITDERMQMDEPMPFDGKRLIYGGFTPIFDTEE
jgi:uncharacterized protein YbaA (DUF1428 family)